ncbi:tRNA threonylcarbamoyl adenosine modification protein YeaZ [Anseongella ginsenosidimutans]|uniref:tRNA threonylcarbamoyl adenosine modification protein YeaZ n=1 Tax=Anseongella ginsenosidimutans TaxID=496056 RepID=A0A4R3KT40_9SPHI|nr:tRNA (adenosine(37)-N6)-threonylcarbamoyltransferase complex dimerization subunit type 1 TsaB [Anseongella ginsenosidimutans]TCS88304.1 tRNA threonylcarbamoyl adenosine modification protein YeaZ [Anseongella ginsenosidimutans]
MALILHLETATPTCSVALSEGGVLLSLKEKTAQNIHASVITLFIETVMQEAGRQLAELDAVSVSKGPGSYTGLRIGVSAAKGLCYALDKPLLAVNTLEAMASGLLNEQKAPANSLLCPMLDARRMEVFMAIYRATRGGTGRSFVRESGGSAESGGSTESGRETDRSRGTESGRVADSNPLTGKANTGYNTHIDLQETEGPRAQIMEEDSLDPWLEGNGKKLLLFGTGAEKCRELYKNRQEIEIIPDFRQSAANLLLPAERKFGKQQFEDVAYFEPFYLKDFISTSSLREAKK